MTNHYDPKSTEENPRWFMVDIKLVEIFREPLGLPESERNETA